MKGLGFKVSKPRVARRAYAISNIPVTEEQSIIDSTNAANRGLSVEILKPKDDEE